MFKSVIALLLSNLLTGPASALPIMSLPEVSSEMDDSIHKASIYAVAPMDRANWIYVGYAPRMLDPKRVSMTISKASYTVRVTLEMTEQEVAEYPKYLIARAEKLAAISSGRELRVIQPTLWNRYQNQINQVRSSSNSTYANGLNWLKTFFPKNVFELAAVKANGAKVIAHFVYPVTMVRQGGGTAPDGTYYTFSFEERKTLHRNSHTDRETGETHYTYDHIFGGFPALWFYPSQNGIGIHGPIRYSEKHEKARDGQTIPNYWLKSDAADFGYDRMTDIVPSYRWDLVRKKDSAGCVRSESMEIRHLLPSQHSEIARVPIHMTSKWDQVEVNGKLTPINVDYYVMDPYSPQISKEQWLQQMAPQMLNQVDSLLSFPYLDPQTIEFVNKGGSADAHSMSLLNQAPY